jgi:hypothetical protein
MDVDNNPHTEATNALKRVGDIAEQMEEEYKEKIELLEFQRDDLLKWLQRVVDENDILTERIKDNKLYLYYAVSLMLFVYGMIYGVYMNKVSNEEL